MKPLRIISKDKVEDGYVNCQLENADGTHTRKILSTSEVKRLEIENFLFPLLKQNDYEKVDEMLDDFAMEKYRDGADASCFVTGGENEN